jgi:hypothetical protein
MTVVVYDLQGPSYVHCTYIRVLINFASKPSQRIAQRARNERNAKYPYANTHKNRTKTNRIAVIEPYFSMGEFRISQTRGMARRGKTFPYINTSPRQMSRLE